MTSTTVLCCNDDIIVWEWLVTVYKRWRPYEPMVSNYIESEYFINKTQVLDLGNCDPVYHADYDIDLNAMMQTKRTTGKLH